MEQCAQHPTIECRYGQDHDLLIELKTLQQVLINEVKDLKASFVTKDEFNPVKRIVYTLVGTVLIGVVSGILAFVLNNGGG